METVNKIASISKELSSKYSNLDSFIKNNVLCTASDLLIKEKNKILSANSIDIHNAANNGIKGSLLDRLKLNTSRIESMADGLKKVSLLEDPIGKVVSSNKTPNGLMIEQIRVPFGVIGIIYEARPNVTSDAFGLCLKTGNVAILRGGKEAIHSNKAIVQILQNALEKNNLAREFIQLIEDTSRESALALMKMNEYIDVLIPRGGAGLIQSVVKNSTIPIIETGVGNCHVYIDSDADYEMACNIVINSKTHRPGVCNAAEKLLIHKEIADKFLPVIYKNLINKKVLVKGDEKAKKIIQEIEIADAADWSKEYLDLIISIKIVEDINDAITHIQKYGTGHSESIVTNNYSNSQTFLSSIDAAAVYVNASTRFTDGEEFGFGAEIGISTQKMHARGPMGLKELTSTKYIIRGNGQIRK